MTTLGKGLESLIPPSHHNDDHENDSSNEPLLQDAILPLDDLSETQSNVASSSSSSFSDGENENRFDAIPKTLIRSEAVAGSSTKKKPKEDLAIFYIEVEKIMPNREQPRRHFDEAGLRELAASIREFGILQPIVVRKIERDVPMGTEVEYELIAGERRLMASKMLGLERIPAVIRNVDLERERLEIAVIENIQREDLNPIEMARAFARLQDEFRMTQREVASRLGKSRETVANTLRLLDLPPEVQKALEERKLSESHGRLLLTIDDPGLQIKLFYDILATPMTTRELRNRVRATSHPEREEHSSVRELPPELLALEERLSAGLGAPVKIEQQGESGKITISFYSKEELENIMQRLGKETEEDSFGI